MGVAVIDVVIPLRDKPSTFMDLELRFALRSIERYFPVRDVWCVGIPRDTFALNWIEQPDLEGGYDTRHESVRQKILKACENPFISDPFALWNDDFFLLRTVNNLPDYYDGTIEDRLKDTTSGYAERMKRTIPYSDGRNYEVHTPVMIDKKLFKKVTKEGMLYRNLHCSKSKREKVQIQDPKLYNHNEHLDFRKWRQDKWMFSTSDISFHYILPQMRKMYPEKSRWE